MSHLDPAEPLVATASLTVGPFFHVGPMNSDRLGRMVEPDAPGEHITVSVRVLDGDGAPVDDAMIELWHPEVGLGRLGTDASGWCRFDTVRPPAGSTGHEAAHFSVLVFARGLLRHLYTRLYFDGDTQLSDDPLWSVVPESRRTTLLARSTGPATWQFVVHLQGDDETVFLDI
jgi:protocatechuate 3,4-dioxygenase alpha subunit